MQPSEVRKFVLDDHRELRHRAMTLEGVCHRILQGDLSVLDQIRPKAERLLYKLAAHMTWEDRHLKPVLLDADAWGEERAACLDRDHAEQRELLGRVIDRVDDKQFPPVDLARMLAHFIEMLLADMLDEEETLLDPRVLRDDIVGIDVETG